MLSKKEKEQLVVEKYLSASNQCFEIEGFESPDFILKGNRCVIGCEVTDFHPDYSPKGSDLHKRESFINDLHKKIRSKLLKSFPFGYSFTINYIPTVGEKSQIDSEVDLVSQKIIDNIGSRVINTPSTNIRSIFFRKIGDFPSRISLMIRSDYIEPSSEWIEPIIESKSKKVEKWTGTYDKKWLVISIGLSRTGDMNLKRLNLSESLKSDIWDKIILIDIHFSEYLDINAT